MHGPSQRHTLPFKLHWTRIEPATDQTGARMDIVSMNQWLYWIIPRGHRPSFLSEEKVEKLEIILPSFYLG